MRKRSLAQALKRTAAAPAEDLRETANSYFGLLSQASHSEKDRAALARVVLKRGNSVNAALTKTFQKNNPSTAHASRKGLVMNPIAQQALDQARGRISDVPGRRAKDRNPWALHDEARLVLLYPSTPMPELIAIFGRPYWSIYNKAYALGLRRSDEYLASEHACRLRREDNPGIGSRFQKGQTSWNKGISYAAGGRSAETRFKAGTLSGKAAMLLQPVGTERVTKDGIRQRKILDDGPPQRRWKSVHMILWEEANGAVPPGHIVVFRDKNTKNINLENLELISRAENMRRNTIHRYPPELKETIRQLGKLKRAISEAPNEKQDD